MDSDFHIFLRNDGSGVTVEHHGADTKVEFPSLFDATRQLRGGSTGFVVIHDWDSSSANRIPLAFAN